MPEIEKGQFVKLLENVRAGREVFIVGIDGLECSGKTAFTEWLTLVMNEAGYSTASVSKHTFVADSATGTLVSSEPGDAISWPGIAEAVLTPLSMGEPATFQVNPADPSEGIRSETIEPIGYVFVEGKYTLNSVIADFFDFRIWVFSPVETRKSRWMEKDPSRTASQWSLRVLGDEKTYLEDHEPDVWSDFMVDASVDGKWMHG